MTTSSGIEQLVSFHGYTSPGLGEYHDVDVSDLLGDVLKDALECVAALAHRAKGVESTEPMISGWKTLGLFDEHSDVEFSVQVRLHIGDDADGGRIARVDALVSQPAPAGA